MYQGVGFASMLVPFYTAECAPPKIRGRLVGIYEIGVQIGTCLGFWINYGVDRNMAPTSSQWMTPFALQLIPGGLLIIGLVFMPESPRWMAKAHGRTRAVETLSLLRGLSVDHPAVKEEVGDILHQLELELSDNLGNTRAAWKELMQPGLRNRVFVGVMIMIFFQMCGSNSINYYSPQIFRSIGLHGAQATLVSTGIYGIVRLVAVFFAMYFLVDRFGRKPMLIGGSIMIVSPKILCVLFKKQLTPLGYLNVAHWSVCQTPDVKCPLGWIPQRNFLRRDSVYFRFRCLILLQLGWYPMGDLFRNLSLTGARFVC